MANTTIQLKRSSVAGKQPNTTTLSIGELAINITDKKLYSSDGTNIFEPAGNVSTINITGGIKANGSLGTAGQVLASNGSSIYWTTDQTSGNVVANAITTSTLAANAIAITSGTLTVGNSTVNTDIGNNYISVGNTLSYANIYSNRIIIGNTSVFSSVNSYYIKSYANGDITSSNGVTISGNFLQNEGHPTSQTSLGSAIALGTPGWNGPGGASNFAPQGSAYAVVANLFFVNTSFMQMGNSSVYFNMTPRSLTMGNTVVNSSALTVRSIVANGSLGTAGQVLATNGTAVYWTADQGANAITANSLTANAIAITTGTLTIGNSTVNTDIGNNYVSVGNSTSYANIYSTYIRVGNTSVFSTINSSALSIKSIVANGSVGTAGYVLSTNGTGIYWSPAGSGTVTITNNTPSNIKNIVNTSVSTTQTVVDTANATGISTIEYLISARDNTNSNYKSSRVLITTDGTTSYVTEYGIVLSNNSAQVCSFDSDINTGNIRLLATGDSADVDVSLQRVVLGSATEAGDIAATPILDSVTNTAINIAASANAVKTAYDVGIAGQMAGAAAYTNAVSYVDTKIGTANSAITGNASAAYTNAVVFAANASNINSGTLAEARLPYRMNQNIQTTDSVQFTSASIGGTLVANTQQITVNNMVVANGSFGTAGYVLTSAGQGLSPYWAQAADAGAAYTNAVVFAANASNINSGTLAEARLPYRMNQNVRTSDTVEFSGLTLTGNLVVSGNVNIIGANNLSISDNMIYLNSNNDVSNPDLGFAGNYNDGTYHHAGFFRDASDGIWKVFDNYDPEPDASAFIDTSNASFSLANFQANTLYLGNTTTNWVVANSSVVVSTGTVKGAILQSTQSSGDEGGQIDLALAANNTTLTGGIAIDVYQNRLRIFETGGSNRGAYIDLSAASTGVGSNLLAGGGGGGGFTNGQSISVNNFVITGVMTANSSNGTSGQVLTSNGSGVYWSSSITSATTQSFTGNGSNTQFTLATAVSDNNVLVTLDGLVQIPITHYSISGTTISFVLAPPNSTKIEVRTMPAGITGISTGKSIAMALVFGG